MGLSTFNGPFIYLNYFINFVSKKLIILILCRTLFLKGIEWPPVEWAHKKLDKLEEINETETKGRFTQGVEAIKSWGRFNQNFSRNGPKFGLKWSFLEEYNRGQDYCV
jgi:hypothetical protein